MAGDTDEAEASTSRNSGYSSESDWDLREGDYSNFNLDYDEPCCPLQVVVTTNRDLGHLSDGSDWDLPEGDYSELFLDYKEPDTISPNVDPNIGEHPTGPLVSATTLGKRKENASTSEYDDESSPNAKSKRVRTPDSECDPQDVPTPAEPNIPYLIAYCPRVQCLMNKFKLSHGVCFELARMITTGRIQYRDITEETLQLLRGTNDTVVPKLARVFQKKKTADLESDSAIMDAYFSREIAANSPWKELDREEAALARGPYGGLGNNPAEPDWYGGKVEFRGRLKSTANEKEARGSVQIVLDSCTLGRSTRFTRRFGSYSFMRIKIPQDMFHDANNNLNMFFKKQFVMWGKVFRAAYAKNNNVFLYWGNETYPPQVGLTIPGRLSFEEFIEWHNPIEYNSRQLMTKWSARFALGFSNSIPGPVICQEFLHEEEDIVSQEGSDMTDGCGYATKSIYRVLLEQLSLTCLPSAFQFRLAGCKGMLIFRDDLTAECQENEHHVWVRPSQTKIRYAEATPLDPAMLTFDILRVSRLTTPSKLSSEIIINIAENGVPHSVFVNLLKHSIQEIFEELTTWEGPDAMLNLWVAVERAGGVMSSRRAREAVGEARVRGYSNRSPEEVELDADDDDDIEDGPLESVPKSVAWWGDEISGCPSALEETVMVLLDSGFKPQDCPILREKLRIVVKNKIENRMKDMRFAVKESCIAFAVPDPYNVLGPDEIQIKSSRRNLVGQDGLLTDIILGDVLIGRNPCKVPSDIRKVKAVDHPMLRNYVDVIVFSIQGYRRLIDFLGGGDYDGDTVLAIWCTLMVLNFRNANEKYSVDPPGLEIAFKRDDENGECFLQRIKTLTTATEKIHAMQEYLLGALVDPSLIGKYSVMHTNAIYELGYSHPRTHKIAAKFVRVLDSSKTGYRIKQETVKADMKIYHHPRGPQWQAASKEKNKSEKPKFDQSNIAYLKRDQSSSHVKGIFIMDRLRWAAEREKDELLAKVDQLFKPSMDGPDSALTKPWHAAMKWAKTSNQPEEVRESKKDALEKIVEHVEKLYAKNKGMYRTNNTAGAADSKFFTERNIVTRQDELRALSRAFAAEPQLEDVPAIPDQATLDRLKASYAYVYDAEQNTGKSGWSRFPWNVALRELCAIKSPTVGSYKVVSNNFYERFKLINPR